MEWIETKDKLPRYGEPLLVVCKGVIQDITYEREAAIDDGSSFIYFHPYHLDFNDDLIIASGDVDAWCYISSIKGSNNG